ncbi:ATP-dependent RNA helicase RhlB [Sansalvadorimonas sp. 2012CJ34-2]|uniref:ATP-dependent RNA helicase RhlB n=1 Tax=Parendozoicomonas callyspongiae TaxID=2942213 RepID=A0ABT0PFR3_9GAMM|nr:ATP-dependent RNA helicase RhlB [Sansalvadorimonas sp. 2012CJ34-2]MCL6270204.1 ATP-dependent RNA helicase RhlB [Sansalvadorimonas sp. 2012CJ34-2]
MSGFLNIFGRNSKHRNRSKGRDKNAQVGNTATNRHPANRKGRNADNRKGSQPKRPNRHPHRRQHHQSKQEHATEVAWDISQFQVPEEADKKRFHDFDLPEALMHGIAEQGFKYCTPIQAEVLGATLQGRDAIGKAQTGTGKTAAFLIATIKQLMDVPPPDERFLGEPRAVIIAPTRELAMQIHKDAQALTKHTGLHTVMVVGGMDYEKQRQQLQADYVDILVATPGRLLDYCERRDLYLDLTETLVIDEADRMLDMGFIPQVRRIVRSTPRPGDRQTLLFSATFSEDVIRLGEQWTWHPLKVEIEPESVATETVDQKVWIVSTGEKYKVLFNMITRQDLERVIVFTNRRDQTRRLTEKLRKDNIRADMLSGDVPQKKRVKTLEDFRQGRIRVLVATDVAGRGIHVDGISHVVNYNLPEDAEDYVHRIGRTGRAGTTGISVSFACEDDSFLIPTLEELLGERLSCTAPPSELL